jgi:hypothetical protein
MFRLLLEKTSERFTKMTTFTSFVIDKRYPNMVKELDPLRVRSAPPYKFKYNTYHHYIIITMPLTDRL